MVSFQKRGLVEVVLLCLFTFGIYQLYWNVVTKRELNKAGAQIPNAFLMIIPLVNFYFWYCYAKSYVELVRKSQNDTDVIVYFLVACMPLFRTVLFQKGYNEYRV